MAAILPTIGLIVGVLLITSVATRFSLPAPILLVLIGLGVSFIPGIPGYEVSPEIVLYVLLPPLLYGAAYESSAVAIRRLIRPIVQLAVVLVLLTAFTVAFVVTAIVPGVPFAAALALGAIVAPPDAVAAVAVARKVGLPRRLLTVLEGESLFNDATSLVTLKVAIAAIGATSVAWAPALGEFAWASGGGVIIGVLLGLFLSFVRRHAGSPLTITALSLVTPFAAYLIGEEAHASGVLVVVVTGLVLGYRSPTEVAASVRLTETATWAALRFVLEGGVFALIGLELRGIIQGLDTSTDNVFLAIGAVLLTVIVSRPIWVGLIHAVSRLTGKENEHVGRKGVAAVSWAGMRGVVSLAAAQTLPLDTPFRSLLLVCTITVILGTLVLQGLSLPWVIRRLGIVEDTRADDLAERTTALTKVSEEINARVDALCSDGKLSERQGELMRKWASLRDWRNWEDDDASRDFARRLSVLSDWRRTLLGIEREVIVGLRNSGELSENVLNDMQHDLDLEEALLERRSQAVDGHLGELPAQEDPEGSGRPELDQEPSPDGESGDRRDADVDEDAAVDDADVSALLMDEQRAEGTVIGQRSGRTGRD
ncbi:Na+/H+ antiporter [Nakamurella flavida]|uniref:Na+/H+ antiporter n=1 Tax=Nakamurella flavida TaxID=363630 RepID=A0A938YN33_9ACTN|nr:Na+/H+ antiporter [Nakamurella flavida]MBM9477581.1 Na+/H+ antiporter [Nakamurella flavida]MDP9779129.1 CPA1 family monovalent cation:H+ antiporter [Nakamurella flavida]